MYKNLLEKINSHNAKVGVIGQGYVGLPLSCQLAKQGFSVTGFEVDESKVKMINNGKSYIDDVSSYDLKELVRSGKISADSNFRNLSKMDVLIICVPTPLRKAKDPDVSYILEAAKNVRETLKKGQLVILESTTYPGTTEELVLPILEETGLEVGKDFFLAFSPERIDPSNKKFDIKNTPKIVGGICEKCTELASNVYSSFTKVYKVSSSQTAEMVKLLENTFRSVNIALVNEVTLMCDKLGLNVWEIIDAASTKPFGFMPFYPGPGIGGHCIPLDPHYLSWKLKTVNFYSRFIDLAGDLNAKMPDYVVSKLQDALNVRSKVLKNAKILILGIAYKKDVADERESPAIDVINILFEKMANVFYYDPHVPIMKNCGCGKTLRSLNNLNNLNKFDAVVVVTDHSDVDYKKILKNVKVIVDTRNVFKNIKSSKVIRI
ncbi:MAG: nucleotide sugar dehydrogenase [Endomicrobium sp.]|jgi:UDP-N-acetyl-D-glucosamine dehydrogenase|uniref:nucleotide sugar dehydrogenase n=1 Tax=Candidatus Endomicrobiellum cubanum TaxID=3242325 RepID=UPI00281A5ED5|nr:nucleotide sugar dehydrogenase [Endomicrobium sp.]